MSYPLLDETAQLRWWTEDEEFRESVNKRKEQLRARKNLPWYTRWFPFKIKIVYALVSV